MKIVLISRIFYPLLSPRAFRTTELAKEFARRGHDVTVYAVLGNTDYTDFSRETGIKVKPIKMFLSTSNSDGNCRYNVVDKLLYHLFHYLLEFPDIEFCWKIPAILKTENDIDILVTVAYPHPIHWGAAISKVCNSRTFPKKWISDCGDPYMGDKVNRHPFYFKYVEEFWSKRTDFITIPIEGARNSYPTSCNEKIRVIPQGFNFDEVKLCQNFKGNDIPHFAYAGTIYPGYRDPSNFLTYLSKLSLDFVFTVYTNNPIYFSEYKRILGDKLIINPYIPRLELIFELSRQDFLVNFANPNLSQSPSKLIDYYLSDRPIISLSNDFTERTVFEQFMRGDYSNAQQKVDVEQFNIANVVDSFLSL